MKRILIFAGAALALSGAFAREKPPRPELLKKADVLPLALDDAFQFRKTEILLVDPFFNKTSTEQMITFERQRVEFKAITAQDRRERHGEYFTFFWRASRPADVTVRFEYRQEFLGPYVQARELSYKNAKGTIKSQFNIIGDDYAEEGRVTSWRALLIEEGKIVGLTQSFLWH